MREEGARKVLDLLAHNETQRGQHGNAAVRDLRLAPATDLLDRGCVGQQVCGVENVGEGVGDAGQRLCICATQKRRMFFTTGRTPGWMGAQPAMM